MPDLLGPGAAGALNAVTSRPAFVPLNQGPSDPDTWVRDCTSPIAADGTQDKAAHMNALLAQLRNLIRAGAITENSANDFMVMQAVRAQRGNWLTAGGSATAITLSPSPSFTQRLDLIGVPLRFLAIAAATGAVTITVNALSPIALTWPDGTAIAAGDWQAGAELVMVDDGTAFRLLSPLSPTQVRALQASLLPIFPMCLTSDGRMPMSHSAGNLVVTGATIRLRGTLDYDLTALAIGLRTFATVANKTYHLRYDATNGLRLLDLVNGGTYNPSSLTENNVAFDSTYTDALLARVVTNDSNVGTVTVLANLPSPNLRARSDPSTTSYFAITTAGRVTFDGVFATNWARTPSMVGHTLTVQWNTGPAQATMSGGNRQEFFTVDRYGIAWRVSSDWNDNDALNNGLHTMQCSGSIFANA